MRLDSSSMSYLLLSLFLASAILPSGHARPNWHAGVLQSEEVYSQDSMELPIDLREAQTGVEELVHLANQGVHQHLAAMKQTQMDLIRRHLLQELAPRWDPAEEDPFPDPKAIVDRNPCWDNILNCLSIPGPIKCPGPYCAQQPDRRRPQLPDAVSPTTRRPVNKKPPSHHRKHICNLSFVPPHSSLYNKCKTLAPSAPTHVTVKVAMNTRPVTPSTAAKTRPPVQKVTRKPNQKVPVQNQIYKNRPLFQTIKHKPAIQTNLPNIQSELKKGYIDSEGQNPFVPLHVPVTVEKTTLTADRNIETEMQDKYGVTIQSNSNSISQITKNPPVDEILVGNKNELPTHSSRTEYFTTTVSSHAENVNSAEENNTLSKTSTGAEHNLFEEEQTNEENIESTPQNNETKYIYEHVVKDLLSKTNVNTSPTYLLSSDVTETILSRVDNVDSSTQVSDAVTKVLEVFQTNLEPVTSMTLLKQENTPTTERDNVLYQPNKPVLIEQMSEYGNAEVKELSQTLESTISSIRQLNASLPDDFEKYKETVTLENSTNSLKLKEGDEELTTSFYINSELPIAPVEVLSQGFTTETDDFQKEERTELNHELGSEDFDNQQIISPMIRGDIPVVTPPEESFQKFQFTSATPEVRRDQSNGEVEAKSVEEREQFTSQDISTESPASIESEGRTVPTDLDLSEPEQDLMYIYPSSTNGHGLSNPNKSSQMSYQTETMTENVSSIPLEASPTMLMTEMDFEFTSAIPELNRNQFSKSGASTETLSSMPLEASPNMLIKEDFEFPTVIPKINEGESTKTETLAERSTGVIYTTISSSDITPTEDPTTIESNSDNFKDEISSRSPINIEDQTTQLPKTESPRPSREYNLMRTKEEGRANTLLNSQYPNLNDQQSGVWKFTSEIDSVGNDYLRLPRSSGAAPKDEEEKFNSSEKLNAATLLELLPVISEAYKNNAFSEEDEEMIRNIFGDLKTLPEEERFKSIKETVDELLMGDEAVYSDYDVSDSDDSEHHQLKRSKKHLEKLSGLMKKLNGKRVVRSPAPQPPPEAGAVLALLAENSKDHRSLIISSNDYDDDDDEEYDEYYDDEDEDEEYSLYPGRTMYEDDDNHPSFGELIKLAKKHRQRKAMKS